jgi:Holliday junction DNA helicase RuvA
MIGYLSGKVLERGENWLVIQTGGVGYKVFVAADVLLSTTTGQSIELFCHHHFSQDSQSLWGFPRRKELDLFQLLIGISGIGPKGALSILSHARAEEIESAIVKGDAALFTAVSGVGKKKADHIILELKPKLTGKHIGLEELGTFDSKKVVEALLGLGYRREEILSAVKEIPPDLPSDSERIKWALRQLYR